MFGREVLPGQAAPFTVVDAVPIKLYQLKGMDG